MNSKDTKKSFILDDEINRIVSEYQNNRTLYEDYASIVENLVLRILRKHSFKPFIEKRSKDPDKLRKKLLKRIDNKVLIDRILDSEDKEFSSWRSIQDLAGVRVIFNTESELTRFIQIIHSELGDSIEIEYIHRKGYESIHIVFSPDKSRQTLSEYKDFTDLKCEIQLRTMLSHAWADVSHAIFYKTDDAYSNFTLDKTKILIGKKLEGIKAEYIDKAEVELNSLYKYYKKIESGAAILDSKRLQNISSISSNQEIYDEISFFAESISSYKYELPIDIDIYSLISDIFTQSKSNRADADDTTSPYYRRKSIVDIALKLIDILETIRYREVPKTIKSLEQFKGLSSTIVNDRINNVIRETAKYEYHIIKKYGLLVQQSLLKHLSECEDADIETLQAITSELLDPSFEGNEMTDENTFSWMSGALPVSPETKQIRRQAIVYLFSKFDSLSLEEEKRSIIKILGNACRLPSQENYKDDFIDMVAEDVKYLAVNYENRLFNKKSRLIQGLTIAKEVLSQMIIRDKKLKERATEAGEIAKRIQEDDLFKVYKLLAVGPMEFREENDYNASLEKRENDVRLLIESINRDNANYFSIVLDSIANYYKQKEHWRWQSFSDFAKRMASEKPDVAAIMLDYGLRGKTKPLVKYFAADFLSGFRRVDNYVVWTRYVKDIIAKNSLELLSLVFHSFWGVRGEHYSDYVKKEDILMLEDAVNQKGEFEKYEIATNHDRNFHNALFNALVCVYGKDPKKVERIIAIDMKNHPELMDLFIGSLDVGIIRSEISLKDWEGGSIDIILNYMVEIDNVDHDTNKIISEIDTTKIINLFVKRIDKRVKLAGSDRNNSEYLQFDAIPSYLDSEIIEQMQKDPSFEAALASMIGRMSPKKQMFGMLVAEFIQKIGGETFARLQEYMIASGEDSELEKVVDLMWGTYPPSIPFCFRLVRKTDNPRILNKIESRIFSTGVVSGEYGIYDAYASKLKQVKQIIKANAGDKRVKLFGDKLVKDINAHMVAEKKRVEETKILRKIDFES